MRENGETDALEHKWWNTNGDCYLMHRYEEASSISHE